MSKRTSLAVVGAGPAGISAAIAASEAGVDTVLVDAGEAPGGQVYRPMPATFQVTDAGALGEDHAIGESLRRALARSRVGYRPATRVWSAGGAFRLDVCDAGGGRGVIEADAVIAATGTSERIVPCPGWTLPGVVGLGAAHRLGAVADREFASRAGIVQRRLEAAAEFGAAMSRMMQSRSGQIEGIAPDAIVCRCEDVRRRDIERALELGAGDLNELKS